MSVAEGYDPSKVLIHQEPPSQVGKHFDEGERSCGGALSILTEAESVVNGDRDSDYGDSNANLKRIADISTLIGQPIDASGVCRVMLAVKLARETYKHKRDNLVDLCGYAELLNRLEDSK